jgi:hypothetical protein
MNVLKGPEKHFNQLDLPAVPAPTPAPFVYRSTCFESTNDKECRKSRRGWIRAGTEGRPYDASVGAGLRARP